MNSNNNRIDWYKNRVLVLGNDFIAIRGQKLDIFRSEHETLKSNHFRIESIDSDQLATYKELCSISIFRN